jgi:hypothetical protein
MIREHVLGVEAFSSGPDDPTPVRLIRRSNDVSIVASEEEIPSGPDDPTPLVGLLRRTNFVSSDFPEVNGYHFVCE